MTANTPSPLKLQVQRKQLLNKIAMHIGPEKHLVTVEAPAGYGKSVFSQQWLESLNTLFVSRHLTDADNDVVHFIGSWLNQLVAKIPNFNHPELEEMLIKGEVKPTEQIRFARMICRQLATLNTPLWLAFEDLHLIQMPSSLGFITELIRSAPEGIQFIINSRASIVPLLNNHGALGSLKIIHISSNELSFSPAEINELYHEILNIPLPASVVASLNKKTQGWPMGLLLLEPSLRDQQQSIAQLPEIVATPDQSEQLNHYFQSQLTQHWPSNIMEAFACLSLLEEIPLGLAPKIVPSYDIKELLGYCPFADLVEDKLKLHQLLLDYLRFHAQKELAEERRNQIYRIAADWYRSQNSPETAIAYQIKAGDINAAHDALCETGFGLVASNRLVLLRSLLDSIPKPWSEKHPWLWFFDGTTRMYTDPQNGLKSLLKAKELLTSNPVDELIVLTSLIQYHFIFDSNFNQMQAYTKRAESLYLQVGQHLPPLFKCLAAYNISTGFLLVYSDMGKVFHYSDEALKIAEEMQLGSMRAIIITLRGLAYGFLGDYQHFIEEIEHARPLFTSSHVTAEAKVILWLLKLCCCTLCLADKPSYEREKQLANYQLPEGLPEKTLFIPWISVLDTQIALAEGDWKKAQDSAKHALNVPVISSLPHFRSIFLHNEAVTLALAGDKKNSADAALESIKLRNLSGGLFYTYQNQVTCATAAFLRGDHSVAIELLNEALSSIRAANDNQYIPAALIPLALAQYETGQSSEKWQPQLEEAFKTMREHGYMTLWNWTPKLIQPALFLAIENDLETPFVKKLLAEKFGKTFSSKQAIIPILNLHDLGEFSCSVAGETIVEESELTNIQLRLLALLLGTPKHRLSYDEIYINLWSDEKGDPRNRVDTVISRLRKTISNALQSQNHTGQGNDYLITDKHTVRLQNCVVDSVVFQQRTEQGVKFLTDKKFWQAETAFEQARSYWKGRYFQYVELPDSLYFHQSNLTELYGQVCCELAGMLVDTGELERATLIAKNAFDIEPKEQRHARLLHDLYSQRGLTNKCLAVISKFKAALQGDGYSDEEISEELNGFYAL